MAKWQPPVSRSAAWLWCASIILTIFSGCAPNYINVYAKTVDYDREVSVPTGYRGAGSDKIRRLLRENGWRILDVEKIKYSAEGNLGDYTHLKSTDLHAGGYSLLIRHRDNFLLGIFSGSISTVISLVDNKTHEKIFTVAGRGNGLVKEFESALKSASGAEASK